MSDKSEIERLKQEKAQLIELIESISGSLFPSIRYKGVQVIWSVEDRSHTLTLVKEAKETIKQIKV